MAIAQECAEGASRRRGLATGKGHLKVAVDTMCWWTRRGQDRSGMACAVVAGAGDPDAEGGTHLGHSAVGTPEPDGDSEVGTDAGEAAHVSEHSAG